MWDLTLDVCVVMAAWDLSDHRDSVAPFALLRRVATEDGWMLALDNKGRIRAQYEAKLGREGDGLRWVEAMILNGKCHFVATPALPKDVRVRLKDARFHKEDKKYVETAAKTRCRCLVSYRSQPCNYSPPICRVLRRIDVRVLEPEAACQL